MIERKTALVPAENLAPQVTAQVIARNQPFEMNCQNLCADF